MQIKFMHTTKAKEESQSLSILIYSQRACEISAGSLKSSVDAHLMFVNNTLNIKQPDVST